MAEMFVFSIDENNQVVEELYEYEFFAGLAVCQKRKCIKALHERIHQKQEGKILEVTSKSDVALGIHLSTFKIRMNYQDRKVAFENLFQSSKVFENGQQYLDLLDVTPKEAKKDPRLRNSGRIVSFRFDGVDYPIVPKTAFFDYLYCKVLDENTELVNELGNEGYTIFTDIEYYPKNSMNCQGRSIPIYLALKRSGRLKTALKSFDDFVTEGKKIYSKY